MDKTRRFSITVLGVLASLFVVAVLLFNQGTSIRQQYQVYSASRDAEAAARLLGGFSKALLPMTFERSVTQVSLSLAVPAPEAFVKIIAEQRALYEVAFSEVEKIAKSSALPSVGRFWSEISVIKTELTDLRKVIDADLAKPASMRSPAANDHGRRIIALIDRAFAAGYILRDKATLDAAGVSSLDTLQSRASIIREFGGRGRTQFAIAALNQAPISTAIIGSMRENHGRVLQAWQYMLTNQKDASNNARAGIEELKTAYFEDYNIVRSSMYAASDTGQYPLDFQTFFERSGKALNSADKLVLLLNDEMIEAAIASQNASQRKLVTEVLLSVLIAVSIAFIVWLLVVRVVSRINRLNAMMLRLAGGDTKIDTSSVRANDEIGDMVKAVEVFRTNVMRLEELKEEERQREAAIGLERTAAMNAVADRFASSVGAIVKGVAGSAQMLEVAAKGLSANAGSTDERSQNVVAAVTTASGNVDFVAGAASQLSSSVHEISAQVAHSSAISAQAVSEAKTTAEEFRKLSSVTDQISSVAAMISDIASRTNLLALNATIEAARAGDAGRGFAVVANEVKLLAEQTSRATQEIGTQILAIKSSANNNVIALNNIQNTISKMHSIASSVASAVEEQSVATQEIATNIGEANNSVRIVSTNIASVQEAAALSRTEAEQVLYAARQLSSQAEEMRSEVDGFIASIRGAA